VETTAIKRGSPIFVGPVKDNRGRTVSDKTLGLYDPSLWATNYLVEGVVGSVT
jgi:simple sugar transport system substrate-binding protein